MNHTSGRHKQLKLLMREEVLADGTPVALTDLLSEAGGFSVRSAAIKDLWARTMVDLKRSLEDRLTNVTVVMPKLWMGEQAKAELLKDPSILAVSLDAYDTNCAFPLRASRHFSKGGIEQNGIGERPGALPLEQQLMQLQEFVNGKKVILFEDDMFSGGTARFILGELKAKGIAVLEFVPGLQVSDVTEINGVPVHPIERFEHSTVLDIIDPRDFLFGTRESGLVTNDNGLLYRAPYILPWVDLTARASIPADQAVRVSQAVIMLNRRFYEQLGSLEGAEVLLSRTDAAFKTFVAHCTEFSDNGTMIDFCDYALSSTAPKG